MLGKEHLPLRNHEISPTNPPELARGTHGSECRVEIHGSLVREARRVDLQTE
jgi:hypothetical protein